MVSSIHGPQYSRSIEYPEVGLHCVGRYRRKGSNDMSAYEGWGMRIENQQYKLPHFFSSCKYLEGFLNQGLDPIPWCWRCNRTLLSWLSIPHRAVWFRPGRSQFFCPRFVGVDGVWKDLLNGDGALSSVASSPLLVYIELLALLYTHCCTRRLYLFVW